jgi:PmbA protein
MTEETTKTYLDIAQRCVEKAMRLGAEWCDVSAGLARDISVSIEKTGIKTADAGQGEDVAVRVYVRGGMGYAVASGRQQHDIDEIVERAVALAKESTPDPDFKSLPSPDPAPEVEGLFDDRIAGMTVQEVVAVAVANIERARTIDPSVNLSGHVGLSVDVGALASSSGIALESRGTEIGADIEALVKRGSDTGYFYDFDFGRFLEDTALGGLADKAIDGARRFLGAKRVHSGRMALILGPLASYGFLASLVGAGGAESIQRGRSYLCGKVGEVIGSQHLSITDDGLIPRASRSGSHDGEGTRRRPLVVFEHGRFANLLHNSYTAGKACTQSTGHGTQSGGISSTNLRPALGTRTAAEILKDVKEGIYLESGEIRPDPASGDISASIDFGFYVKDGQIQYPVESAMMGGNMLDLLPRLDAVSSDAREEPGLLMPTVRIQDVQIAGTE